MQLHNSPSTRLVISVMHDRHVPSLPRASQVSLPLLHALTSFVKRGLVGIGTQWWRLVILLSYVINGYHVRKRDRRTVTITVRLVSPALPLTTAAAGCRLKQDTRVQNTVLSCRKSLTALEAI